MAATAADPSPARRGRPSINPSPAAAAAAAAETPRAAATAEVDAGSGYEREREARIRENRERMQKLGILDIAHTLTQSASASARGGRWRRKPVEPGSAAAAPRAVKPASPAPARRSNRLRSMEPVTYSELPTKTEKGSKGRKSFFIEEGAREEIYTEEHEKLLGTCQTPWTLFVDGYDKDGRRIYDQVRGQTCHQCRQKTLGHHTNCCKCQIVQGQFCGDCLFMRYGENVLEAKKNPNWTCPVCRGICNCSICRTKRGWFPTGNAYRKVVSLGYKSVAHYLIATNRASANSHDSSSADTSDKAPSTKSESSCVSEHDPLPAKQEPEDGETSSKVTQKRATRLQAKNSDICTKDDGRSESAVTTSDDCQDAGCATPCKPAAATPRKRKAVVVERSPDGVASRLRSRSNSNKA